MTKNKSELFSGLRDFPSVEILSGYPQIKRFDNIIPKPLILKIIKETVANEKERFRAGDKSITIEKLTGSICAEINKLAHQNLKPVINGTGIIIHTNLGRAPLAHRHLEDAVEMACGYSNLEYDIYTGKRGKRGILVESLLSSLCGTESGTMVNNNAAALFVILNTLANRKEVIISRGELVQIGGGFKIPEIMTRAGVKLIEIGTTNRTSLNDYKKAITSKTKMILKVHRSNFVQSGFVEETSLKYLAGLCREHDILLTHDIGSGLMSLPPGFKIKNEPVVSESVQAGADLTCFSGDKLFGAVQAGLIVGSDKLVKKIKSNPIFRTVRCDKISFAVMAKILSLYLQGERFEEIPIWKMISATPAELKKRGEAILTAAGKKNIILRASKAYLGGGSTPEQSIPSLVISIKTKSNPNKFAASFRNFSPPIIGRVENDEFLIDLRTVFPKHDGDIVAAITYLVN
ncbi:MAG: L-seryl-tRNA(Sec) selenium transferase [candidate division Zixibacteria bacterium]